jgi:ABC-type transport system involved in multi-copper enzyme maturation permease subunit
METALDLSRWREKPKGVGYRRRTIVLAGLKELYATRLFRLLLGVAWAAGALIAALGFLFSQSVADGGMLQSLAAHISPRAEAMVTALDAFVLLYPDIIIHTLFTAIFWAHSFLGLTLSLLALTVIVPRLITRDRASNALVVYLSRPLTSADYLLGRLGTIAGVLVLMWTGPLVAGWMLSMLLSPNGDFIVYSFLPLLNALLFNAISLVALASIALGVSALCRSSRTAIILWIGLWIIVGAVARTPHAPDWIHRASFSHDLAEVRQSVFKLDDALTQAGNDLPLLDQRFAKSLTDAGTREEPVDFYGSLAGLGVLCVASSLVFFRKLRPE